MTDKQLATQQNAEMIRQAQMLTGEAKRLTRLFFPSYEVNNKAGVQGLWILAKKGKDGKIENVGLNDPLEGVILKVRMSILSKYEKDKPGFYSYEFDDFNEQIQILQKQNDKQAVIFQGNYKEIKKKFATELDAEGIPTKTSFTLFYILYFYHVGHKQTYRLKFKGEGRSHWFQYAKTFDVNDTFMGYKTKFNVNDGKAGNVPYKYVSFERGEKLSDQNFMSILEIAKRLHFALMANDGKKPEAKAHEPALEEAGPYDEAAALPEPPAPEESAINVDDIDFN